MPHLIQVLPDGPDISLAANDPTVRLLYTALNADSHYRGASGNGEDKTFFHEDLRKALRELTAMERRITTDMSLEIEFIVKTFDYMEDKKKEFVLMNFD